MPNGHAAFREIKIDGKELDFSSVSEDLHVESYKKIISNQELQSILMQESL